MPGYGPTAGAAIAEHMDVNKLAFTGSTEVCLVFVWIIDKLYEQVNIANEKKTKICDLYHIYILVETFCIHKTVEILF